MDIRYKNKCLCLRCGRANQTCRSQAGVASSVTNGSFLHSSSMNGDRLARFDNVALLCSETHWPSGDSFGSELRDPSPVHYRQTDELPYDRKRQHSWKRTTVKRDTVRLKAAFTVWANTAHSVNIGSLTFFKNFSTGTKCVGANGICTLLCIYCIATNELMKLVFLVFCKDQTLRQNEDEVHVELRQCLEEEALSWSRLIIVNVQLYLLFSTVSSRHFCNSSLQEFLTRVLSRRLIFVSVPL